MKKLSKEILDIPTWYFTGALALWEYTESDEFKEEPFDVQAKMLKRLSEMEGVRPEDMNMKVEFR